MRRHLSIAALAATLFGTMAYAGDDDSDSPVRIPEPVSCSSVNGVTLSAFGSEEEFNSSQVIAITIEDGARITFSTSAASVEPLFEPVDKSSDLILISQTGMEGDTSYSAIVGGTGTILFYAEDTGTYTMSGETVTITCTPGVASGEETVDQTAALGITSTRVKTTGLGFRADAGGGAGGASGSGNGTAVDIDLDQSGGNAFLAQSGDSGWTAWLALELRKFDGDYDGHAVNFAGGADYQVSDNAAVGVMLSFGQSDLEGGFGDFESSNRGVGPYFLYDFGNGLSAEGFLVFEAVAYDSAGGEFDADRLSYGLTLKGSAEMGGLDVTPFLRLEGFNEDQEAYAAVAQNDVTYRTLAAGARIDFDMGDFDPYLSLALENRRLTSESSPDENFNAPRLGFGFDYSTSPSSTLSVDIDAGKVLEDTRDYGLILTYEVDF